MKRYACVPCKINMHVILPTVYSIQRKYINNFSCWWGVKPHLSRSKIIALNCSALSLSQDIWIMAKGIDKTIGWQNETCGGWGIQTLKSWQVVESEGRPQLCISINATNIFKAVIKMKVFGLLSPKSEKWMFQSKMSKSLSSRLCTS